MASFKKPGQTKVVSKHQWWRNKMTGRIGKIVHRGSRHREWIMNMENGVSHHITEGALLKFFNLMK